MTLIRKPDDDEEKIVERRLIRVDCPSAQAGIAAALRRAFCTPPSNGPAPVKFSDLLKRLN